MLTFRAEKFDVPGSMRTTGVLAGAVEIVIVSSRRPQSDPAPTTAAEGAKMPGNEKESNDTPVLLPARTVRLGTTRGAPRKYGCGPRRTCLSPGRVAA